MKSWRLTLAPATGNIILLVLLTFQNEGLRHFTPKGVNRYKVYKAFCSTLSEFHRIRPKQSFLANTPQSVFVILGYRSFQTKVRHKNDLELEYQCL